MLKLLDSTNFKTSAIKTPQDPLLSDPVNAHGSRLGVETVGTGWLGFMASDNVQALEAYG